LIKMTYKNIFNHCIWRISKMLELTITRDNPREFIKFAKEHFNGREIIGAEIGVQYGMNALYMLKELNLKRLYLIDPYERYLDYADGEKRFQDYKNIKGIAIKRLNRYKNKTKFVYLTSKQAFPQMNNLSHGFDFVYLDANHSYEFVKYEIENYWTLINNGGILGGHDFEYYEVAKAVIEFAEKNKLKVITKSKNGEWIIVKE